MPEVLPDSVVQQMLVAVGTSGGWEVTLNERIDRDGVWLLELSGPSLYMTTPCERLETLSDLAGMLHCPETGLNGEGGVASTVQLSDGLRVCRDDESASRCHLVLNAGGSFIRVGLNEADQVALAQCLEEIFAEAVADGAPASDEATALNS